MEEYDKEQDHKYRLHSVNEMVIVHSPTPGQLVETCEAVIRRLESDEGEKHYRDLVEETRQGVIPEGSARLGFVCSAIKDAIGLLRAGTEALKARQGQEGWELPAEGVFYHEKGMSFKDGVVVLFPGQGSQYVNMGKDLAWSFPPVRAAFEEADSLFIKDRLDPLSRWVFPIPVFSPEERRDQEKVLTRTENAQPAIGALSAGLYRLLQQAGLTPDFVAGHSFGELTALWAAGVYDGQAFFKLAQSRGRAMMPPKDKPGFDARGFDPGAMLAVKGSVDQILLEVEKLSGVRAANINSGSQVVLAGETEAIKKAQSVLQEKGYSTVLLPVSAAFHTALVKHAQEPFAEVIKKTAFKKPRIRVYSNTTARPYPDDVKGIKATLQDHILHPVLFKDQIENIYNDGGRLFIEAGPNGVLTKLVRDILKDKPHTAIALNPNPKKDSDDQIRQTIVRLKVAGLELKGFDPYQKDAEKIAVNGKNRMMSVTLNGSNYVSEKTRKAFDEALRDGYCVQKVKEVIKTEYEKVPEPSAGSNLTEILDNLTLGQI